MGRKSIELHVEEGRIDVPRCQNWSCEGWQISTGFRRRTNALSGKVLVVIMDLASMAKTKLVGLLDWTVGDLSLYRGAIRQEQD